MWGIVKKHPLALVLSILGHLVLLAVLIYSFDFDSMKTGHDGKAQIEPIKATVVNEKQVQTQVEKLKKAEEKKRQQAIAEKKKQEKTLQALETKRKDEEKRLANLQREREREEKKQTEEKARKEKLKKEQAEQARLEKVKKEKEKKAAEKKKRAAEEKRREAEEKRLAEEKRKEEKRQAELKRQKEKEERIERERIAVLEAERQREEDRIAKIESERQAAANAEATRKEQRRLKGLRAEYVDAISQKVSRNWIKPDNVGTAIECTVNAMQIPSGEVIDVNVLSCTGGGDALSRSVELAVRKASPLPLPKDPALFDRRLEFTFEPK